jgi:hypothetical protein
VAEFDDRADEMRRSLAALKRSYVIKLFADHADTQSPFGSLAKDLELQKRITPRRLSGGEGASPPRSIKIRHD